MRRTIGWTLAAACALVAPLSATVLVPATLADLSREAHVIARGRVVQTEVVAAGDWRSIETIVTLATEEALKGDVGSIVQFRMPGGQAGRYRRVVVGAPELRVGQRVVVFLNDRGAELPYVLGMALGLFRLVERSDGWVVTPPVETTPVTVAGPARRGDPSRRAQALAEFERDVRALVGVAR